LRILFVYLYAATTMNFHDTLITNPKLRASYRFYNTHNYIL